MGLLDSNKMIRAAKCGTFTAYNIASQTFDCSGYRTLLMKIELPQSDTGSISISAKDENNNVVKLETKYSKNLSNYAVDIRQYNPDEIVKVDLTTVKSIKLLASVATLSASNINVSVYFFYDEYNFDIITSPTTIFESGTFKVKPNTLYKIRVNLERYDNVSRVIRFTSSVNDEEYANHPIFSQKQNGMSPYYFVTINNTDVKEVWTYTKDAQYLKITTDWAASMSVSKIEIEEVEDLERTFIIPHNAYLNVETIGTFKYAKISMVNREEHGKKTYIRIEAKHDNEYIYPSVYIDNEKPIIDNDCFVFSSNAVYFYDRGEILNGEFVLKYEDDITSVSVVNDYIQEQLIESPSSNFNMTITFSQHPFVSVPNNSPVITVREKYQIKNWDIDGYVEDALGVDVLVRTSDTTWKYYKYGLNGLCYDISFDTTHCPSKIEGETVKFAKLVPITSYKPIGQATNRIVFFTNKNRLLYNRVRSGYGVDYSFFREASVINTKKRWYPVNSKSKISDVAKYLPIFPQYDYNQFNGRVNDGNADAFGLQKPNRGSSVGSLLEDYHKDDILGKLAYSSFVHSEVYGTVWGNYNLTDGDPWVAITGDGANWYIVEAFGSVSDFNAISDLKVNLSPIITNAGGYTSGSLKATWRKYNVPTDEVKEPTTPFVIGESCIIDTITADENGTIITFVDDSAFYSDQYTRYKFTNFRQVVFLENISASSEYDYICNSVNADGSNNSGVFFRLVRIEGTHQYKLLGDVGNPYEGYKICRHVHSVSEASSGFLIATGENYFKINDVEPCFEGGFLFYIPANFRNAQVGISNPQTDLGDMLRLSSSRLGVNRACGAYLKSDKDNTLIYVSDECIVNPDKYAVTLPGRTQKLTRMPLGVMKGSLTDVDDINDFGCVAEIKNTAIGLVYNKERFALCLFGGDAIFSSDFGETWHVEQLQKHRKGTAKYYTDVTGITAYGSFFYDNNEIVFK